MIRYFWPSDDEQLAGQNVDSHFDEDGAWWASLQQSGAVVALAFGLTLLSASTVLATSVFAQHQDDPVASFVNVVPVQEEYWQNPVPPVNWPQPSVLTDDDVRETFVQVFQPDEDRWDPQIAPVPAQMLVPLPLGDQDLSPQFTAASPVFDDASTWGPQPPPQDPPWTLMFFLDDGSTVPLFQYDEDFWLPQIPPQNWPQASQPLWAQYDEIQVTQFVAAEDPVWLQLVAPVQASLLGPTLWTFEQNEPAGTLASFTDELFWQSLVAPLPAGLIWPQPWAFEQTDATGALFLDLDEGLPGPLPAPVPATNSWLQQWPFEQNEPAFFLTVIHEEDYWRNPVAPLSWPQPSTFSSVSVYDDVLGFAPATAQDEDFWDHFTTPNVPPVQATMLLRFPYQPDPEEIPAGSLVPFIPPPPTFCPLPPCGPDPDICISTFSNFKGGPVLALFCRLCNSGKPLVVRGDYAIWCQDCCAFVSKQDTYMGTVQSPGQFRGRF